MKWSDWSTGSNDWPFGTLIPDEVLYEYAGPAIFTINAGLQKLLFYKSSEYENGDYYVVSEASANTVSALKSGRLSMRGALTGSRCWLFDINLDMQVKRYEESSLAALVGLIPAKGVSLNPELGPAADSIEQATSPLSFKFFGEDLLDGLIPMDIFKGLVNHTYDVVRRLFVPRSLRASKSGDLIAVPMRTPVLASLLIALEHPSIDVGRLRRRESTKLLDPEQLEAEAEAEGAKFVGDVERTVERAYSGKAMKTFARDNFDVFDSISDIVPAEGGDVSKLQLSSSLGGRNVFFEVDREAGERIRHAYKIVRDSSVDKVGIIAGTIDKSHLIILRPDRGREVTCYLSPPIFDDLLARGELRSGRRLRVSGSFTKRTLRDLMHVDGAPLLL